MAISTNLEHLGYGAPAGTVVRGLHRPVVTVTANKTLTAKDSGSLVVFDVASGALVTLPAPVEGMQFDVLVKTTITSNTAKIITDAPTTFLVGAIQFAGDASTTLTNARNAFAADGTTHVSVISNGTTTGGKRGTMLNFTAISETQWAVSGVEVGSGTVEIPFAIA